MQLRTPGARVANNEYGDGTIIRSDEYHTVIDFDAYGLRTFSSSRVVLVSSNTTAPPKPPARKKRVSASARS